MSGAFLEKAYGIKNLLKAIGVASQINRQETTAQRKDSIPDVYQGKLQLFILAGQSNMSGMGDVPLTNVATNTRIYVFGNDYRWKLAEEPVDDPRNQVDLVSEDKPAGFGPSVSFATTLLQQRPNIAIGLIPCAKGGSLIHEWQRNLNDMALYGSCLKRVRAASVMGTVAGLLFFQGEIDAIDPTEHPNRTFLPHRWANEFTELISDWRSDLSLPELPVVFAQIGTNTRPDRFKHWAVVKEQQRQVRLPFAVMMTTADLPWKDYVHFTTESYQIIGQRFANAYLTLWAQMNQKSQKKE
ncbi:MAG: sialate O-acetylesterase [Stenomitos frigidus ULC029]